MTLDKLPAIRGDLVQTDPDWEKWNFAQLSKAVRLWTKRNPIEEQETSEQPNSKRDRSRKLFQARGGDGKPNKCVYCGDVTHRSSECQKISTLNERKQFLARKQLCFNCATPNHHAAECFSKKTCLHCHKCHDMWYVIVNKRTAGTRRWWQPVETMKASCQFWQWRLMVLCVARWQIPPREAHKHLRSYWIF